MYQVDNQKFGLFLSKIRKSKQMTQKDLADKLFVSDKTVSKWERGNSMPNVSLLIPLAEILEVTVTELLQGEKTNQETANMNTIINNPTAVIQQSKKKWRFVFLLSIIVVLIEILLLVNLKFPFTQISDSILFSILMLLLASWFCLFAKDLLPNYYDKDKINFVHQGIFRIHTIGLSFNNGNWSYILIVLKIFTLAGAVLTPLLCYLTLLLGNIILWNRVKYIAIYIFIILLIMTIYIIGKKYE